MKIEHFIQLYLYVNKKWDETILNMQPPCKGDYNISLSVQNIDQENTKIINTDANIVSIYPASQNQNLWIQCSKCSNKMSLCLNILNQREAKDGIFLNASVFGYEGDKLDIAKLMEEPQSAVPIKKTNPQNVSNNKKEQGSAKTKLLEEGIMTTIINKFSPFNKEKKNKKTQSNMDVKGTTASKKTENIKETPPFCGKFIDDD
jgi:hypothetical protein